MNETLQALSMRVLAIYGVCPWNEFVSIGKQIYIADKAYRYAIKDIYGKQAFEGLPDVIHTPDGMVILLEDFDSGLATYKQKFYRVDVTLVMPNDIVRLMDTGWLPMNKTTWTAAKAVDSKMVLEQLAIQAEAARKKEAATAQYEQRKAAFFEYVQDGALAVALWNFDYYYQYSDDIVVYRAGVNEKQRLMDLCKVQGKDVVGIFAALDRARAAA